MSRSTRGRKAVVLIVGGEARWNDDIAAWLDARGYELIAAETSDRAVEVFCQRRPELVLLNLPLAGVSASGLARELLAIEPGIRLVVSGTDADVSSAAD